LGQKPPTLTPEVFAPGLISKKDRSEFGSVFNKEATEFYYGVDVNGRSEIRYTKLQGVTWGKPQTLLSHDKYSCNDPFLSPDGNRLYFISNKALLGDGVKEDYDIWYIKREGNRWNPKMINAGPNINSKKNEYYCSFSNNGNLYFASNLLTAENKPHDFNIYVSKFVNGSYQKAIPLTDLINTKAYEADVFVAPDESYIIFCSIRKEGFGKGDLYICFKDNGGNWSKAKNMGALVNTEGHELCPFVSKDGEYFFFTSNQDIYWMETRIIDFLKDYQ
jgi:Tol biopolymer transport system component